MKEKFEKHLITNTQSELVEQTFEEFGPVPVIMRLLSVVPIDLEKLIREIDSEEGTVTV